MSGATEWWCFPTRQAFAIGSERSPFRRIPLVQRAAHSLVRMHPKRNGSTWSMGAKSAAGSAPNAKRIGSKPTFNATVLRRSNAAKSCKTKITHQTHSTSEGGTRGRSGWLLSSGSQHFSYLTAMMAQTSALFEADRRAMRGVTGTDSQNSKEIKRAPLDGPLCSTGTFQLLACPC